MIEMKKAVIDRIVDGKIAVLLVGDDEMEIHVNYSELPNGAKEGSHLLVNVRDGQVTNIVLHEEEKNEAEERIAQKMVLLRKRMKKK